mmetsp:Transcript_25523/g.32143  ORF Transcript_25523/g.32143 Transcript_25523/m.32143 type:complete len:264 (-) Transcript_25523:107-898(-)
MCITSTENHAKIIEMTNEVEKDVMMQSAEIDIILAFLKGNKEAVMFEYGSGGSTHYFAPHCKKLYSAEHTPAWSDKVAKSLAEKGIDNVEMLSAAPDREAFEKLGCTDIGIYAMQIQVGETMRHCMSCNQDPKWLNASTEERSAVFKDYLGLIEKAGEKEKRFDLVLVDGRVRGECAIAALPYLDENSVVVIHDWFLEEIGHAVNEDGSLEEDLQKLPPRCELPPYKRVLEYFDVVCEVKPGLHNLSRSGRSGAVVLRKKAGL